MSELSESFMDSFRAQVIQETIGKRMNPPAKKTTADATGPKVAGNKTIEEIIDDANKEQAAIDEEIERNGLDLVESVATKESVDLVAQLMSKL